MSGAEDKILLLRGTPYRIKIRGATVILEYGGKELPPLHPDTAIDIAIGLNSAAGRVK